MPRVWRVLSIDGGGVRGIIPAMVLEHIEKETGKPVCDLFDLIVGTSAGGLVAAASSSRTRSTQTSHNTARQIAWSSSSRGRPHLPALAIIVAQGYAIRSSQVFIEKSRKGTRRVFRRRPAKEHAQERGDHELRNK